MLVNRSQNSNQGENTVVENQPRLLSNSDRIQIKFGSYNIDIIENDINIRVSKLFSTHNGKKVNRTFAVVSYPDVVEPAFKVEHESIVSGQSIGVVFEQNGWTIDKHHLYLGEIDLPVNYSATHSLFGPGVQQPAIHIYSLDVSKNDNSFTYALIAEVHHPEFLQLEELQAIYGKGHEDTNSVQELLQTVTRKIGAL